MTILETIRHYKHAMTHNTGKEPGTIPLTTVEISDLKSEAGMQYSIPTNNFDSSVFGMDMIETPFAKSMRARRINMHLQPMVIESSIDSCLMAEVEAQLIFKHILQIKHRIVSDTTKLNVEFEWDCWAKVKRFLCITKWFPIKKRKAVIDCLVLYPYIKISLPHNRHHVQFKFGK